MKKIIILFTLIVFAFVSTGCATWGAIKEDSSKAWKSTKKAINNATKD